MVMGLKDLLPAMASCCANIQMNLLLAAASIAFAGDKDRRFGAQLLHVVFRTSHLSAGKM
jgi:hypothetical protein